MRQQGREGRKSYCVSKVSPDVFCSVFDGLCFSLLVLFLFTSVLQYSIMLRAFGRPV